MGFATTAAIVGTALSAHGVYKGIKDEKEIKDAISEARETEPTNAYEDVRVERGKYDSAKEYVASGGATAIASASRDTRSLIPVVESVNQSNVKSSEGILNLIAAEEARVSELFSKGESERQRLIQRNEEMNLLGLGSALQSARQDTLSAVGSTLTGALSIGSAMEYDNKNSQDSENYVEDDTDGDDKSLNYRDDGGERLQRVDSINSNNRTAKRSKKMPRLDGFGFGEQDVLELNDITKALYDETGDIFEELGINK